RLRPGDRAEPAGHAAVRGRVAGRRVATAASQRGTGLQLAGHTPLRTRTESVTTGARYIVTRIGWAIFLVFGVCSASFVITRWLPGDPARMLVGPQASIADVARARSVYGLDEPAIMQYGRFWRRLVHTGPHETQGDPSHGSCAPLALGL